MDIDLAALRGLERERDLSLDIIIPAIEQAMLVAYHRTEGARRLARVELDRKTGHVIVWAREEGTTDPDTEQRSDPGPEFDDTPAGFGRIAASTARQVIVQRLRDLEDEAVMGDFHGREGDIITGVIQQSSDPRYVMVDFGTVEGSLPLAEQVPGEKYIHGQRLRCLVVSVKRGQRGPQIGLSRTHPNLVRKLFALEIPEVADGSVEIGALAREAGHRTKVAVHSKLPRSQCQGRLHRADGRPGPGDHDRAAWREDRRRGLLRRPSHLCGSGAVTLAGELGGDRRPGLRSARVTVPTSSCRWRSARKARTPGSQPS